MKTRTQPRFWQLNEDATHIVEFNRGVTSAWVTSGPNDRGP